MAFHNVRLPEEVERGAKGGPRFKTTVLPLASGYEKRNIEWANSRGEWDVGYGIQSHEELAPVINFFYARMGQAHSFRFKDWSDFKMTASYIGTGDGATLVFQACNSYESGSVRYKRTITKLVSGTTHLFIDGVELTSGFSINVDTGVITFSVAPLTGVVITLTAEFDCHVRFNDDALDITADTFDASTITSIKIIELKGV